MSRAVVISDVHIGDGTPKVISDRVGQLKKGEFECPNPAKKIVFASTGEGIFRAALRVIALRTIRSLDALRLSFQHIRLTTLPI